MTFYAFHPSPLGDLLLISDGCSLTSLLFHDDKYVPGIAPDWRLDHDLPIFIATCAQMDEYFAGERRTFELPLLPRGTNFQCRVWGVLREIPYGETTSYGAMARKLGQPTATRAVGAANGRNPIAVVVPCHRAIGADGSLTGYAGGLDRKRALLELEATIPPLFGARRPQEPSLHGK